MEQAPEQVTPSDRKELLHSDIKVLRILKDEGPLTTAALVDQLYLLKEEALRRRLYHLMALDNRLPERDTQLLDRDLRTGKWHFTTEPDHSARGAIPDDKQQFTQRVIDEQTRRSVAAGDSVKEVADTLCVTTETALLRARRAAAHEFPLSVPHMDSPTAHTYPARSRPDSAAAAVRLPVTKLEYSGDTETGQPPMAPICRSPTVAVDGIHPGMLVTAGLPRSEESFLVTGVEPATEMVHLVAADTIPSAEFTQLNSGAPDSSGLLGHVVTSPGCRRHRTFASIVTPTTEPEHVAGR